MKLDGNVSIVTGGGKGIGKAIALQFAREGSDVVVCGRTEETLNEVSQEIRSIGKKCLPIVTDVSKKSDVVAMVDETVKEFSKIDVLVCNVGIAGVAAPVVDMEEKDWDECIAINLKAAFLCCQAVLKYMIPRRRGRIITISAIGAHYGYMNRSPYACAKLATLELSRVLAAEVGQYGISVNDICPGPIEGERMNWALKTRAKMLGVTPEEAAASVKKKSPLLRFVKPEEVAKTAAFLASDEATGITGVSLNVSVGFEITQ